MQKILKKIFITFIISLILINFVSSNYNKVEAETGHTVQEAGET